MLETNKEYQELATFLYDLLHATNWEDDKIQELFRTFEALRDVARAAEFAVFNNAPFLGQADLQISIDALPDWLTDG